MDKVVIVTGASSGIGEGISYLFASHGCKLSVIGRNKDRIEKVATTCVNNGLPKENVICMAGDLTDGETRNTLIQNTLKAFGRIDVLINNAGVGGMGVCADTSESDYRHIIETNQSVPFFLTQLAIPHLKESKGNVVNVSSVGGHRATLGITAYCMSKAALNMFTQCLALELAPFGVRVNSVSPGSVPTGIARDKDGNMLERSQLEKMLAEDAKRTPLGRTGTTQEIAEAVFFLASDKASWTTGENMMIDGGFQCASRGLYVCDLMYENKKE